MLSLNGELSSGEVLVWGGLLVVMTAAFHLFMWFYPGERRERALFIAQDMWFWRLLCGDLPLSLSVLLSGGIVVSGIVISYILMDFSFTRTGILLQVLVLGECCICLLNIARKCEDHIVCIQPLAAAICSLFVLRIIWLLRVIVRSWL